MRRRPRLHQRRPPRSGIRFQPQPAGRLPPSPVPWAILGQRLQKTRRLQKTKPLVTHWLRGVFNWVQGLDLNQRPSGYEPNYCLSTVYVPLSVSTGTALVSTGTTPFWTLFGHRFPIDESAHTAKLIDQKTGARTPQRFCFGFASISTASNATAASTSRAETAPCRATWRLRP